MSQISMPMRILLIGAVVFLAAWFTILKPGGGEEAIPPVQPANVAEQPATPATSADPAATPAAAEDTTVAAAAIPADVLATLPKSVAKAIQTRKTLVFGVFNHEASNWRPMADDDRYVRNALKKTNRYDGEVFAKNITLADLSTYGPLVNELGVTQSPAVVVIDRNLKGTVLTGYVDRIAINQAIADARRDSIDPAIQDEYLRWTNESCADYNVRTGRWSLPTIPGDKAMKKALKRQQRNIADYIGSIERQPAPAKYKAFKKARIADLEMRERLFGAYAKAFGTKTSVEALQAKHIDNDVASKVDNYFNDLGLSACAAIRRS